MGSLSLPLTSKEEAPSQLPKAPSQPALPQAFDISQVKLEGTEDPRNWSQLKKWTTASIISLMGFVGPLGASIVIASASGVTMEFKLPKSHTLGILPVSLFVLGLGAGPFCLAPASELKGRQPIYLLSSIIFVIFNIGCSLSNSFATLCVLRFFAGVFGSSGPSLGAGTIGDMFAPSERGSAQAIYGLGPLLGPVIGNIVGGWVEQSGESKWRWLLWILTIMSACISIIMMFVRETFAPVLLQRKRKRIAAEMLRQAQQLESEQPSTASDVQQMSALAEKPTLKQRVLTLVPGQAAKDKMKIAFSRPFRLLFTNPICAAFSLYMGFCYGIVFLFLVQHPLLYQRHQPEDFMNPSGQIMSPRWRPPLHNYEWKPGPTGLTYLGLGLGFLLAALCNATCQDRIYRRLVASRGKVGWYLYKRPEKIAAIMLRRDEIALKNKDVEQNPSKPSCVEADVGPSHLPMTQTESEKVGPVQEGALPSTSSDQIKPAAVPSSPTKDQPATVPSSPTKGQPPAVPSSPAKGQPEYRLPLCLFGMFVLPLGLLIFGWTAQKGWHWTLPLVGSFFVGAGTILCFQSILVYLVDAFIPYSASATACAVLVRSVLAAVFPLFSYQMYEALGYGWGSSLLAFVALAGIPVPIVLFRYGAFLREKYKFIA